VHPGHHEAMNQHGSAEGFLRLLRAVILIDGIVAVIVGVISLSLGLYTPEAYGTLLVWAGIALIVMASILGMGSVSSRLQDVGAFNLSGAGDMSENLRQIAESGRSSLGCSLLLILAGITLLVIGSILQVIPALFGFG
jgi:hypothetical protein